MYSNLLRGRINRRTFLMASAFCSGVLLIVLFIVLVPIALLGILAPRIGDSGVVGLLTVLLGALITLPYLVIMASLVIRRAHDFGSRGSLWIIGIVLLLGVERLSDNSNFRLLVLLAIFAICVIPGNSKRNRFGGKPSRKFVFDPARLFQY